MTSQLEQLPLVCLSEWQSIHLAGKALSDEDRHLVERLSNETDSRLGIDELRTGLRISARSWVGVVRFSSFELQVVPKLVGQHLDLLKLIDFATGLECLSRYPAVHTFEAEGTSLLDLIALLLAEACERLVRGGLLADYREVEDDLPVVRGRMLLDRQMRRRMGRIDRLECRFDEQTTDVPENQILLAALSVCAPRVKDSMVALRIRRLLNVVSDVCSLEAFDLAAVRAGLAYHRLNAHYRDAHGLSWLVLEGLGIDDLYAGGTHHCFAFMLDMNRLFEAFVTRWLTRLLSGSGFHVLPQRRDRSILWDANLNRAYAKVIPDILIQRDNVPGRYLPIDAKYKLYDERKLAASDIYQTFLYAYAYGGRDLSVLPQAIVLYPASSEDSRKTRLHVQRSNMTSAELHGLGIHIPTALAEVQKASKGTVGDLLVARVHACFASLASPAGTS